MFTFKWLEMMNWDFWSHVRLPLDEQVVLIAGPNGSGKTTLLDAVRVLLNARKLSTSRKMPQYLRDDTGVAIVKAVVTNPLRRGSGKRPFSGRGLYEEDVTLACVLERKQGQWQRRYHILSGDASIESIKAATHALKPEEYSRALEEAQVPRTLLKILALEQGETHKLAQRTPEQLLEYVLELQGDKQVLDRYADARSTYIASQKELEDFETRLENMALHVDVLRRDADQVRQLQVWLEQEKELREVKLPASRYKRVLLDLENLRKELQAGQVVLKTAEANLHGFSGEEETLRAEITGLKAAMAAKRKQYEGLLADKEKLDGQYRDLKRQESELTEATVQAELQGGTDVSALRTERERLVGEEATRRRELSQLVQKISDLRAESSTLDGGGQRRPPPENTAQMLRELRRDGIDGTLVADTVEIADPFWQVAVESILGSARFSILVDPKHELAARKVGQKLRYRNYIAAFEPAKRHAVKAGSALSVVTLLDQRLPEYIVQMLASVQLVQSVDEGHRLGRQTSITPDGYRQDSRGGIFVGVSDLYCGASAGGHRKAQIDSELGQLRQLRDSLEAALSPLQRRVAQLDEVLLQDKVRDKLVAKIGDIATLPARISLLAEQRVKLSQDMMALLSAQDTDTVQVTERERRIAQLEWRHRDAVLDRDRARAHVSALQVKLSRLELEQGELMVEVPETMRSLAALELLESETTVMERLAVLREQMQGYHGSRDPRAIQIYDKAATELSENERILAEQRRHLDHGNEELVLARQAYKRVVLETIRRYRQNVMKLGELCRVDVQVKVPGAEVLRDDHDDLLGKAGLEVRIGFDGKKPVAVDDPKLSGGQSVVSSLILLMALTMEEGGEASGFFILDEPFAHLSVERIDEVARFLQVTRAQFIITTPTTHNLLVYNPARLTLNLRKKAGNERHAPVPTFLRR
jgi:chromosome segregation ATPase